jgi:hypothetical protein
LSQRQSFRGHLKNRGDFVHQRLQAYRFADETVHSCVDAFLARAVRGMRRQGDHGHPAERWRQGANMPSCCQAVHFRHLHVHQHDIERLRACVADGRDCRWAAIGGGNAMSGADQQTTDHLLISDSKCIEFGIFG